MCLYVCIIITWWSIRDLNPWPLDCQSSALPTELMPQDVFILAYFIRKDKRIDLLFEFEKDIRK